MRRVGLLFVMRAQGYLRTAPLTVAVACGPLLDALAGLDHVPSGAQAKVAQLARGILTVAMLLSVRPRRSHTAGFRVLFPLFALAAYGLLQALVLDHASEGAVFGLRILFLGLVFLNAYHLSAKGLIGTRWTSGVAWFALATLVISQLVGRATGVTSVYEGSSGMPGVTGQPAIVAASACALIPLFAIRPRLVLLDVGGLALSGLSVAATQRRSAIFAAVAALLAFGVLSSLASRRRGRARVGVLFAVIGLSVYGLSFSPLWTDLRDRFSDLNVADGGTGSGRTEFQRIAVAHVLRRDAVGMTLGEGPGALRQTLSREFGSAIGGHNDWIDVAYAFGVIGVALFFLFHVQALRLSRSLDAQGRATLAMTLVGMIALGLTTGGTLDPTAAATFAALGLLASRRIARSPSQRHGREGSISMASPHPHC